MKVRGMRYVPNKHRDVRVSPLPLYKLNGEARVRCAEFLNSKMAETGITNEIIEKYNAEILRVLGIEACEECSRYTITEMMYRNDYGYIMCLKCHE